MWVPKYLLLPEKKNPKNCHLCPEHALLAILGNYRPCQLKWCPVGWFGVGCGTRAALTTERLPTLWLLGASFCSSGHHHRNGDHVEDDVLLVIMIKCTLIAIIVKMIMMIMKMMKKMMSLIVMLIDSQLRGGFEQDSIRVRIVSVSWCLPTTPEMCQCHFWENHTEERE